MIHATTHQESTKIEQQKNSKRSREQQMNDMYIQQQRIDTHFGNLTGQKNAKRNKRIENCIDWNERDVNNTNPRTIQEEEQQQDLISGEANKIHAKSRKRDDNTKNNGTEKATVDQCRNQ